MPAYGRAGSNKNIMDEKEKPRTIAQLREQYLIERELSDRLRHASKKDRGALYSKIYDELYRRVPHHPQLTRKISAAKSDWNIRSQVNFLRRFITSSTTFLEIGPGDCRLSFAVAQMAKQVFAVDVSSEITKSSDCPSNFELIISAGSIPLPDNSIDVAYSNQLMEHLHPDDAMEQLAHVCRVLKPGGKYVCVTPNRLNGPHDISKYFDEIATGLHLREYTVTELSSIFREAGFESSATYISVRRVIRVPSLSIRLFEMVLERITARLRRRIGQTKLARILLDIRLVATK